MTMEAARALLQSRGDQETYTTVLMAILLRKYGPEFLEWLPESVFMQVVDDFRVELDLVTKSRIAVGMNLLTSDDFYARPSWFVQACEVLTGGLLDPSQFTPADAFDCLWGVTEAVALAPPEISLGEAFHPEISAYIALAFSEEGFQRLPESLSFATTFMPSVSREDLPYDDPELLSVSLDIASTQLAAIETARDDNLRELAGQLALIGESPFGGKKRQRQKSSLLDAVDSR